MLMSLCSLFYTEINFLMKLLWPGPSLILEGYLSLVTEDKSFWSSKFGETSLSTNLPKRKACDPLDHKNMCSPSLVCSPNPPFNLPRLAHSDL